MKTLSVRLLFVCASIFILSGCAGLLTHTASPSALPVELGAASTNDFVPVAWVRLAQAVNAAANPTPTEAPINVLLGAAAALLAAAGGWASRHFAEKSPKTAASPAPVAPSNVPTSQPKNG